MSTLSIYCKSPHRGFVSNYAPWHADFNRRGRSLLQTERFKFFPATGLYSNPVF